MHDIREVTCLEGRVMRRRLCIPVHGVALPYNDVVRFPDSLDVSGKILVDLVCAITADNSDLARDPVGVDNIKKADKLIGLHARPDLDAAVVSCVYSVLT